MPLPRRALPLLLLFAGSGLSAESLQPAPSAPPALVLLTLDTTRADALGSYGGPATPSLDALAARGTRWSRALTSSPLTLPAHATLLTGLEPPEHGVRGNGTSALAEGVPSLATRLAGTGWSTAAFVSSLVLDRRFGLANGFQRYDDILPAERLGQYGYPERDAAAVTDAALAWLAARDLARPFFLWVHYYDPHAPYQAAGGPSVPLAAAYHAEVSAMDRQVGRLLGALPDNALVAAVGDHGEALGEHGEKEHGLLLYRGVLEVPMIVAGPFVPAARVVDETVGSGRLAASLLTLLGQPGELPGELLPGLPGARTDGPLPVYSEARLGANAYDWSPLTAISEGRWRLVRGPRPELFDFVADPTESRNLLAADRSRAARLEELLGATEAAMERRPAVVPQLDPEIATGLRALGYLTSGSQRPGGKLDPKDGLLLLRDFERAKALAANGAPREALVTFERLIEVNPGNIPFLSQMAGVLLTLGDGARAIETCRTAVELDPRLDFLRYHLAQALERLGRRDEAAREYRVALALNPRMADASLALARLAHDARDAAAERQILATAVAAGTASARVHARLAQISLAAGELDAADQHSRLAVELAANWQVALFIRGRALMALGELAAARAAFAETARVAPRSPQGREARRLLQQLNR